LAANENKNRIPSDLQLGRMAFGLLALLAMAGCDREAGQEIATGGDPQRGKALILQYGCNACHVIDGIEGAIGQVGPPLTNIRERSYIAGVLSNTPANMQRWIMNPTEASPKTAMPDLGVTEEDARDIAAFLYSQ
jgi:cytochrome c